MANIFREVESSTPVDDRIDESGRSDFWLRRANEAYEGSSSIWETNYYRTWERNQANFHGRHPSGSRYHSDEYKRRSRLFRPKSRSAVRRNEAAANLAFFSTNDVVSVDAEDESEFNLVAADIRKQLLNYRLTSTDRAKGLPWFTTLLGAYQESQVTGVVCSYQSWLFEEDVYTQSVASQEGVLDGETGRPWVDTSVRRVVRSDRPDVELVPLENIRFHPVAKWNDIVNSSPYFIHMMPMYAYEVREKMEEGAWIWYDDIHLASSRSDLADSVSQAREGTGRQDPKRDQPHKFGDYSVVWVHRNIMRYRGQDMIFYTLGTHHRLTEPVPLVDEYWHGKRPYVIGSCIIEAHRPVPSSPVELAQDLQAMTNEIANSRIDNVRLVLNKRYFINRNGNVDIAQLRRNAPGSTVAMDDPTRDVHVVDTPDVTSSAYAEQDRLNIDFDDLMGTFSAGSVQSNRKLNETVGGMNLLSQDANQLTEHQLKVFSKTWVEPVVQQIDALEMHYESDETVLAIAGQRSRKWAKIAAQHARQYGQEPEIPRELLTSQNVEVSISVGFGATSPMGRIEKMSLGLNTVAQLLPNAMARAKEDDILDEIFGVLGYQSGSRFFTQAEDEEQDPRIQQLQQVIQQLQQEIAIEAHKAKAKAEAELQVNQLKVQSEVERQKAEAELQMRIEQLRAATRKYEVDAKTVESNRSRSFEETRHKLDVEKMYHDRARQQTDDARSSAERVSAEQLRSAQDVFVQTTAVNGQAVNDMRSELLGISRVLQSIKEMGTATESKTDSLGNTLSRLMGEVNEIGDSIEEVEEQQKAKAQASKMIRDYLEKHGSEETKKLMRKIEKGQKDDESEEDESSET